MWGFEWFEGNKRDVIVVGGNETSLTKRAAHGSILES